MSIKESTCAASASVQQLMRVDHCDPPSKEWSQRRHACPAIVDSRTHDEIAECLAASRITIKPCIRRELVASSRSIEMIGALLEGRNFFWSYCIHRRVSATVLGDGVAVLESASAATVGTNSSARIKT